LEKVRVGMIGLGGVGTWGHLHGYEEIPEQAKLAAFCDTNPGVINEPAMLHGAKTYSDYNQIVTDPNIDIIDICVPHFLHGRIALAAIKAGKNVICEKPFTTTLEEADAIINAAKDKGVKLMVAENTRFVRAYQVAHEFIEKESIGEICFARTYLGGSERIRLSDPDNWIGKKNTAGGGVMFDAGVHSFYLLRWMVGEIKTVQATTMTFFKDLYQDVEDNAMGTLRFVNGAIANFSLSNTTEAPWTERLEIFGTKGSIIVDMLSERPIQVFSTKNRSEDMAEWWSHYGDVGWMEPYISHSALEWKPTSMRREVQHFVECVLEDKQPLVSGQDGRRDVEISLKCYESAKLGKEIPV